MMPPFVEVRPASPDDLPALAAFIARENAGPTGQCLYCTARSAAGVRAALRDGEHPFVVGLGRDGGIAAAVGCQFDPSGGVGWLWGPWGNDGADLLDHLVKGLPDPVRRLEAFLHAENRTGLDALRARGFSFGPVTHIYVRPRAGWNETEEGCPLLRPAHEVAFRRLHAETFPAGASTPADDLLAGRDDEHAIFAATDGLRLLGYVCVSVNRAPREGFVDYLAVKETARGRGIGGRLLQTALRWAFETQKMSQAALCVSEWRGGARRLYEQAGFALGASGVGARRPL